MKMKPEPASSPSRPFWAARAERGSAGALRLMLRLISLLGRRGSRWLLHPIAFYFWLTDRNARRASCRYFEQLATTSRGRSALLHEPTWKDSYWHIYEFSVGIFDRLCVWAGLSNLQIEHEGNAHFSVLPDRSPEEGGNAIGKSGALIIGAHVGNFDVMRSVGLEEEVPFYAVMYGDNAQTINSFFEALNPALQLRLIHVRPGKAGASFEIRAAIQQGGFVAIMGDRVGLNPGLLQEASFLGKTAYFSRGPFELAAVIGCPVMMATTLRVGDGHYRVRSWLIYSGGKVRRKERAQTIERMVQRYASILEEAVFEAPYQWFNFFDFWEKNEKARS